MRGRPALHGQAMTPAQRQAKKRTARLLLVEFIRDALNAAIAERRDHEQALVHMKAALALLDEL